MAGCAVVPEEVTPEELADYAWNKHQSIDLDQEELDGPVSLYEAMARALRYNLDRRVEQMEVSLRERQLDLAHHDMLPKVVANAGLDKRNNYSGGRSVELLGAKRVGDVSLRSSTSSERDVRRADITFSWHILDFGLSYVRAKQSANRRAGRA